jgi:hypothetical protein
MSTEADAARDDAWQHHAGRPVVLEPMPPGWWMVIDGTVLAALAPLFGFLVGSMIGEGDGKGMDPIQVWLLVGFLGGGVGVAMALIGAYTIFDRRRAAGEGDPGEAPPVP